MAALPLCVIAGALGSLRLRGYRELLHQCLCAPVASNKRGWIPSILTFGLERKSCWYYEYRSKPRCL